MEEQILLPREIPDFSNLKPYQLISFFREAKFDTLTMHPFLAQYLPTDKPRNRDNQSMKNLKEEGFKEGDKWASKYLFHIPLEQAMRRSSDKKIQRKEEDDRVNISDQAIIDEQNNINAL